MQAVILAAGRGTRMKELCDDCPKPMVKLLGKPLLEWRIETLPEEIDEVILVIGYLGKQIREHFGEEFLGKKIFYVEQIILNGTGGAIELLKPYLKERALVTNGDDLYLREDLQKLLRLTTSGGGVLGMNVENAEIYGLLETNSKGELLVITERPHGEKKGIVNTGTYLLTKNFFEIPLVKITETEYGLPQTLALGTEKYPVTVVLAKDWQAVGCPEDIALAEAFIQKNWL